MGGREVVVRDPAVAVDAPALGPELQTRHSWLWLSYPTAIMAWPQLQASLLTGPGVHYDGNLEGLVDPDAEDKRHH